MDLENITKIYKIKNREIVGLDNFSYSFLEGKFYAIVGHSGSGKTTLISIMGLIEPYTKGKYMINGKDVTKLDDGELSFLGVKNVKIKRYHY